MITQAQIEAAAKAIEKLSATDPIIDVSFTDIAKAALTDAAEVGERDCTCHPADNPPDPCPKQYAYTECIKAATIERLRAALRAIIEEDYGLQSPHQKKMAEIAKQALNEQLASQGCGHHSLSNLPVTGEVGGQIKIPIKPGSPVYQAMVDIETATIERCAQVADKNGWEATAAEIRALKDS